MRTLGIDLASSAANTASCMVEWTGAGAIVAPPLIGRSDAALLDEIRNADRVGIDAPFGWPDEFVAAIAAHHTGAGWPVAERSRLRLRETDRVVWQTTGRVPLSVSSDRIAVVAMRCAELLEALARDGGPVDRAGTGRVVEVYPAAALIRWGLTPVGYKGAEGRDVREHLVNDLTRENAWMVLAPEVRAACVASDHAFDALVAALVARATALGLTTSAATNHLDRARREGWIHVPVAGSLVQLAAAHAGSVMRSRV